MRYALESENFAKSYNMITVIDFRMGVQTSRRKKRTTRVQPIFLPKTNRPKSMACNNTM